VTVFEFVETKRFGVGHHEVSSIFHNRSNCKHDCVAHVEATINEHLPDSMSTLTARQLLSSTGGAPEPPEAFQCPITGEVMVNPVCDREGHTYERAAIITWLQTNGNTSPMTRRRLHVVDLAPNRSLRDAISTWRSEHGLEPLAPSNDGLSGRSTDAGSLDFRAAVSQISEISAATEGAEVAHVAEPTIVLVEYGHGKMQSRFLEAAAMAAKSTGIIEAHNDVFGDPCPGQQKTLRVVIAVPAEAPGEPARRIERTAREGSFIDVRDHFPPLDPNQNAVIILSALYGDFGSRRIADCTRQVQKLVNVTGGRIRASNDLHGDPAPGVVKTLRIAYVLRGQNTTSTLELREGTAHQFSSVTVPGPIPKIVLARYGTRQRWVSDTRIAQKWFLKTGAVPASNVAFEDPHGGVRKNLTVEVLMPNGETVARTCFEDGAIDLTDLFWPYLLRAKAALFEIVRAEYGDFATQRTVDATAAAHENFLNSGCVPVNNAFFGDPAGGVVKELRVRIRMPDGVVLERREKEHAKPHISFSDLLFPLTSS
jgi:hypothetical protein